MKPGCLFILATPIGNLQDLSPRALKVLKEKNFFCTENTQSLKKILTSFSLSSPQHILSYYGEKEKSRVGKILHWLREGKDVVLATESGTPGVSDPGMYLVRAALKEGIPVVPVPGPSALSTALSVSGFPSTPSVFLGFLPARRGKRRKLLKACGDLKATLVIFVPPHDAISLLQELLEILGNREATLCREMTKMYEEIKLSTLSEFLQDFQSRREIRGEITLVISGKK